MRAIWESLDRPYRAAMEQGLIYTRLGNPLGMAEVAERGTGPAESRGSGEPMSISTAGLPLTALSGRIGHVLAVDPTRRRHRVRGVMADLGSAGRHGDAGRGSRRSAWRPRSGSSCATVRRRSACCSASCAPGGASSPSTPAAAVTAPATMSPPSACPSSPASRPTSRNSSPTMPAPRRPRSRISGRPSPSSRVPVALPLGGGPGLRSGCSPAGRRDRRSGSTSPTTRSSECWSGPSTTSPTATRRPACGAASPSSTPRWCTSAGCSGCCSA